MDPLNTPLNTMDPIPFVPGQPAWVFGVFLSMAIVFAWIQVTSYSRFIQLIRTVLSERRLHFLVREGFLFNDRIVLPISYLYVASLSMVFFSFLHFSQFPELARVSEFHLFLILGLLIIGFWAVKILIMNFLSLVFHTEAANRLYQLNILVSINFLGIILFPLLIAGVYLKSDFFLYTCLVFILFASLIRVWKGILVGISLTKFPRFLLFMYLCSLELIPLLLLSKLIVSYM